MIEILTTDAGKFLEIAGHGTVTAEDYERVIVPAVEDRLKTNHKLRFLYHLCGDFKGYTPLAVWDDAKLGIQHLTAFEKIAIVTDVHWVIQAVRFFGMFIPCPVKVFGESKLDQARFWLRA